MKLSFRGLAILSALVFSALALTWMLAPDLLLSDWGVEFTPSAGLVSRRAAALYAGVAVMFFSARNTEPSTARSALIKGVVVACFMLAVLGLLEFEVGNATPRILIAVFIEAALTLAFLYVGCSHPAVSDTSHRRRKA
ncbi:hypothetical protein SAMN04515618_10199 [Collimonas sp. OK307]|uniref:hypothetical protein n=1 Tax=Collimonas sp. OK307 TaxID=1801620 RepID=UPI0008E2AFA3|nr:hypothetical protein [Collimonas sp. OK307]SFH61357.1 hypothetical protein SAMN04515618_10199 [Collimonas sp. OK307]